MILVAFDEGFAEAAGMNVARIDGVTMLLVGFVAVAGLRIVGLVLVVALLIIPAVAARFWTDHAGRMIWIAGGVGAAAGMIAVVAGLGLAAALWGPRRRRRDAAPA